MATSLKRVLTLPVLTLYGLGTIVGAGIYVLIGEVVAVSGYLTPVAFLVASIVAAFSAFSYAELAARFPLSAGEAVYMQRAFGVRLLSTVIGLMIVLVGIVSSATLVSGAVGYIQIFVPLEGYQIIILFVIFLGTVAAWGISQAAWLAVVTTLVEIGGLLLIIVVAGPHLENLPQVIEHELPQMDYEVWGSIFAGAFIAFYAFIGFEDIVNVAEEVKNPSRNIPLAIILALIISTLLYIVVSIVAILAVPPDELAGSAAPLAMVYERSVGESPLFIVIISMAAVINGVLIQIIMASRVLYGMSKQQWLPVRLSRVHPGTQTPLLGTLLIVGLILASALCFPLLTLATVTSMITLTIFFMINLALWRVKKVEPQPLGIRVCPSWLPIAGMMVTMTFIVLSFYQWLLS